MKTLTKAEEQVMQVLWQLDGGGLMEIVVAMPEPQPHKNTVATILKILVDKEFVHTEAVGRAFRYLPSVSKDHYSKASLSNIASSYFQGSFSNIVSFLVDEQQISVSDLELLLKQIKKK